MNRKCQSDNNLIKANKVIDGGSGKFIDNDIIQEGINKGNTTKNFVQLAKVTKNLYQGTSEALIKKR